MKRRLSLQILAVVLAVPAVAHTDRDRALIEATARNDIEAARRLIAAGASVNAQNENRDSAFLLAGAEGRLEILKMTLAAGADLAATNRYGGTALIPACHHGHVETVRELLKTAIDVDHVNRLGWTALLETVILGDGSATYLEIARLLVAHGPTSISPTSKGVTPLAHARQRRPSEALAALLAEPPGAAEWRAAPTILGPMSACPAPGWAPGRGSSSLERLAAAGHDVRAPCPFAASANARRNCPPEVDNDVLLADTIDYLERKTCATSCWSATASAA